MPPADTRSGTPKRYTLGTHRTRTPEETWAWVSPLLTTVGVTRVADVTRLDRIGLPIFQAIRPASRNLSVSQGKAMTAIGARVSAVMEAAELWHAEDLEHLCRLGLGTEEMGRRNPIRLEDLPWRSGIRDPGSAAASLSFEWVEARAVESESSRPSGWLPRQMLELDLTLPRHLRPLYFHQTSNGLASGNCHEEALLHALCELVERHALHLARHQGERKVVLDQDSVEHPECLELMARIRAAGMKLAIYDLGWEVGVPVVMADLVGADLPNVWHGSGCHPSPEVALSRALTEAAQVRLTYISGSRDDLVELPLDTSAGGAYWAAWQEPSPARCFESIPDVSSRSVELDVAEVGGRLEQLGYRSYAVELSRPEVGIPVVRAFVPGLKEAYY